MHGLGCVQIQGVFTQQNLYNSSELGATVRLQFEQKVSLQYVHCEM